jgi:integrase
MQKAQLSERFLAGVRSPKTKDLYARRFHAFLDWAKVTDEGFAALPNPKAEELIEGYIAHLKARAAAKEITESTVRPCLSPIRLFCLMNRMKGIDWDLLSKQVPHSKRYASDRAATLDEIRALLDHAPLRMKAIILLMSGSGFRLGAFDFLDVQDFTDAGAGVGKLVIYRGQPEEYITFTTPEAARTLNAYLEFRKAHGENLGPKSPLIRDVFDTRGGKGTAGSPQRAAGNTIAQDMARLWKKAGVRTAPAEAHRHQFKAVHNFRKYFKTRAEAKLRPIAVETLMGHSTGVSDSYYRPTETELLEEFKKAVADLSISSEERQRGEMKALASKHSEGVDKVRLELLRERDLRRSLGDQLAEIQKKQAEFVELLESSGLIKKE